MRISDWSSDVCSSDLQGVQELRRQSLNTRCVNYRPRSSRALSCDLRDSGTIFLGEDALHLRLQLVLQGLLQVLKGKVIDNHRSEERRVGKECVRTWRSRG